MVWYPQKFHHLEGFRWTRGNREVRKTDCSWAAGFRTGKVWSWSFMCPQWELPGLETCSVLVTQTWACLAQTHLLNTQNPLFASPWKTKSLWCGGCWVGAEEMNQKWMHLPPVWDRHIVPWSAPTVMQDLSGTGGMKILEKLRWRSVFQRHYLPCANGKITFRMVFRCDFSGDT